MNIRRIFAAACLIAGMLSASFVSAGEASLPAPFEPGDESNWDRPIAGEMAIFAAGDQYVTAQLAVAWSKEQIARMQGDKPHNKFFPSLQLASDRPGHLRPVFMITDLPGAKFFNIATDDDSEGASGDGLKVSVLDASSLIPDRTYHLYVVWSRSGDGDSNLSLQSMQGYAQPNGALRDLGGTSDLILSLSTKDAPLRQPDLIRLPKIENERFQPESERLKYKSYAEIHSRPTLDLYREQTKKRLGSLYGEPRFAVTFNEPFFIFDLDDLIQKHNLRASQIYAVGVTSTEERYTVGWFDPGLDVPSFIRLSGHPGFTQFFVAELEGTAFSTDLENLKDHPDIAILDVAGDGELPLGIYDLIRKLEH